jgi:hypothetical protein
VDGKDMKLGINDLPNPEADKWTPYTLKIDAERGWQMLDEKWQATSVATEEQVKAVLRNLTDLRIRGEFKGGADTGYLDNVVFGAKALTETADADIPGRVPVNYGDLKSETQNQLKEAVRRFVFEAAGSTNPVIRESEQIESLSFPELYRSITNEMNWRVRGTFTIVGRVRKFDCTMWAIAGEDKWTWDCEEFNIDGLIVKTVRLKPIAIPIRQSRQLEQSNHSSNIREE